MREFIASHPLAFETMLTLVSLGAGFLGSLLGIGGGFIIIPFLTLVFGIDIRYAIGASLIAVIATSSGAAAAYVRDRYTNMRVAIFLEIATTFGALSGVLLSKHIPTRGLYLLFSVILVWSALAMFRRKDSHSELVSAPADAVADRLQLHSEAPIGENREMISYRVGGVKLGFLLMYIAGMISALLGIGSGTLKVPAMDQGMRLPIKVSSATSNFMMGVTAAASAGIYFMRGDILPGLAGPVALGVLVGSKAGSRMLGRTDSAMIRRAFVIVLVIVAIQMGVKGVQAFR
jgi:uncharacterized membrane protein YfcA